MMEQSITPVVRGELYHLYAIGYGIKSEIMAVSEWDFVLKDLLRSWFVRKRHIQSVELLINDYCILLERVSLLNQEQTQYEKIGQWKTELEASTKGLREAKCAQIGLEKRNLQLEKALADLSVRECRPYVERAAKYGYDVVFLEPETPWAFDLDELVKRNVHGLSRQTLERMLARWVPDMTVAKAMGMPAANQGGGS